MPAQSDYGLITDLDCWKHPAWGSFMDEMEGRIYGHEALNTAWAFYKRGWEAHYKQTKK